MSRMALVVLKAVRYFEHDGMKFKKKLRMIRKHLGFTQDQMAERLGMQTPARRSRVSEWENGKTEPKRQLILKYAELANIDVKQLIDDKEKIVLERLKNNV